MFSDSEDQDENVICNTLATTNHINLRKPSKEEIDRITSELVAQVQSTYNLRNRVVNGAPVKSSIIFIKDNTEKVTHENKKNPPEVPKIKENKKKKWEPKKMVHF